MTKIFVLIFTSKRSHLMDGCTNYYWVKRKMIAKVTLSFFCRFGEIKEAAPNRYPKGN